MMPWVLWTRGDTSSNETPDCLQGQDMSQGPRCGSRELLGLPAASSSKAETLLLLVYWFSF
jgi:hypothetical protein